VKETSRFPGFPFLVLSWERKKEQQSPASFWAHMRVKTYTKHYSIHHFLLIFIIILVSEENLFIIILVSEENLCTGSFYDPNRASAFARVVFDLLKVSS